MPRSARVVIMTLAATCRATPVSAAYFAMHGACHIMLMMMALFYAMPPELMLRCRAITRYAAAIDDAMLMTPF